MIKEKINKKLELKEKKCAIPSLPLSDAGMKHKAFFMDRIKTNRELPTSLVSIK